MATVVAESTQDPIQIPSARWLLGPRWGAALAYLVALGLAEAGAIQAMQRWPVLAAAVATLLTNLALASPRPALPFQRVVALLLFDAAVLTGALYLTGGAANPLSALYLVQIGLGAILLRGPWPWAVAGLSVAAFGALFFAPSMEVHTAAHAEHAAPPAAQAGHHETQHGHPHGPAAAHDGHADADAEADAIGRAHGAHPAGATNPFFDLHLQGMCAAFTLTALLVTYFITRISSSLRARDAQLSRARTRALRAERVASLASMAAATAHELGTPIASIMLAATEMERGLSRGTAAETLAQDARLVKEQARRCRQILDSMLKDAGEMAGETPKRTAVADLVEHAVQGLGQTERNRVELHLPSALPDLYVPCNVVSQAIQNLLRNALEASSASTPVSLRVEPSSEHVLFRIEDRGVGMNAEELEEALEPFVTTRPGRGQGLGLFLTRSVAERLGGSLTLHSEAGKGTVAELRLAREPAAALEASPRTAQPPMW